MSAEEEPSYAVKSVTIYRLFQELDSYLDEHDENLHYDVEAGLTLLHHTISRIETARSERKERTANRRQDIVEAFEARQGLIKGPTAADRLRIIAERIEALSLTPSKILNVISPEFAFRLGPDNNDKEFWMLTWLPGKRLTRRQALSAMVLDDIVTNPNDLDSSTMMLVMTELVADLDMPLEEVLARLSYIKKDSRGHCWRDPAHRARGVEKTPDHALRKAE